MNYSTMLQDFLDHSLASSQEETLFRALTADEELRFELKYLLQLRDAVREDDKAWGVPLASSSTVFGKLGYALPAGVGALGGAAAQTGFWGALKGYGTHLLAGLIGMLLASGTFLLLNTSDGGDDLNASNNTQSTAPISTIERDEAQLELDESSRNEQEGSAVQGFSSNDISLTPFHARATEKTTEHYSRSLSSGTSPSRVDSPRETVSSVTRTKEVRTTKSGNASTSQPVANVANGSTAENSNTLGGDASEVRTRVTTVDLVADRIENQAKSSDVATLDELLPVETSRDVARASRSIEDISREIAAKERRLSNDDYPVLSFGVRSHVSEPLTRTTAPINSSDPLNNLSLSVGFGLSRNLSLLVEAGSETYVQKFEAVQSDGRVFRYEQAPSARWGALGTRYSFNPGATFDPFGQVLVGMAGPGMGLVTRAMGGLHWSLNNNVQMTAGLEYSMLNYEFDNTIWTSPKVGLVYGLTFNLFSADKNDKN